jgi:hypothetical protein
LSQHQISPIIQVLKSNKNTVIFYQNSRNWMLSDSGLNAVMLKMDVMQGRIGTIGAVIKRGNKNESHVYAPVLAPVVTKVPVNQLDQSEELTVDEVIQNISSM